MGEGALGQVSPLPSGQKQVDKRDQRSTHPGGDQDVVGSKVALRIEIEQGFIRSVGHFGCLRPHAKSLCEADHIGCVFFVAGVPGTVFRHRNWSSGRRTGFLRMGQQLRFCQSWRGGRDERLWLSALVDAMEQASLSERRAEPCDGRTLAALRAQLALPAATRFASCFALRN
jgi:hypothetical protein